MDSVPSVRLYGRISSSPSAEVVLLPEEVGAMVEDAMGEDMSVVKAESVAEDESMAVVETDKSVDLVEVTETSGFVTVLLGIWLSLVLAEGRPSIVDEGSVIEVNDSMEKSESVVVAKSMLDSSCAKTCPMLNKATKYTLCTIENLILSVE